MNFINWIKLNVSYKDIIDDFALAKAIKIKLNWTTKIIITVLKYYFFNR